MFSIDYFKVLSIKLIVLFQSLFVIYLKFNIDIYLSIYISIKISIHIFIYIFIYNKL